MIYFYGMIEKKVNKIKNQAVAVSAIAIARAKKEKNKLNANGIRMSLGAIVSQAVMDRYGNK